MRSDAGNPTGARGGAPPDRPALHRLSADGLRLLLGGDGDAEAIYFSIIAMCYWYVAAPQLVRMVFGDVPAEEAKSRYRRHVVATAEAMTAR